MKEATSIKAIRRPLIEQTLQFTDHQIGWFCLGFERTTSLLLENLEPVGDSEYADKLTSQSRYCARVVGDSFLHGTIVRNHLINQGIDAALAFDQPWDSNSQTEWYVLTYDMPPSCLCDFSIT